MTTQSNSVLIMLRLKQVIERTGLSRSTIYGKLDPKSSQHDPSFPTQVSVSLGAVRWIDSEVSAWIEQCVSLSRTDSKKAERTAGKIIAPALELENA
jgi:prophage regulatory protein